MLTFNLFMHLQSKTLENTDDKLTFYILLLTLPLLIITNITYPFPDDFKDMTSKLKKVFAMLDVIDMAELMFGDVGCFQTYETGFKFLFYFALLISAILTSFYYGLEQQSKQEETSPGDTIVTFLNLLFNDSLFLVLRAVTIYKESHAYFGVIFVVKEALSCIIRCWMLCKLRN